MVARPTAVHNNFQEGFGHYTDPNTLFKGYKKWESSGSLDSNEMDIEGLKAAQKNELVFPGQNIIFSSKRRNIRMSATEKSDMRFGPLESGIVWSFLFSLQN